RPGAAARGAGQLGPRGGRSHRPVRTGEPRPPSGPAPAAAAGRAARRPPRPHRLRRRAGRRGRTILPRDEPARRHGDRAARRAARVPLGPAARAAGTGAAGWHGHHGAAQPARLRLLAAPHRLRRPAVTDRTVVLGGTGYVGSAVAAAFAGNTRSGQVVAV